MEPLHFTVKSIKLGIYSNLSRGNFFYQMTFFYFAQNPKILSSFYII